MGETITLRADEKVVRLSVISTWVLIFLGALGVAFIVKQPLGGGEPAVGMGLNIFMIAFIVWLSATLLSISGKQKRQLRDQSILYQLTQNGITVGDGTSYIWSDFKKIYYYKSSVQLLEKGKIINAVVFSPSGIEPKAFKQASLFIKKHAPPEITKSFKPR